MSAAAAKALPVRGGTAVVARRHEPADSLDFFPTPPWATRAFLEAARDTLGMRPRDTLWDPACGEGHLGMAAHDMGFEVKASDIFDYGYGGVSDFLGPVRWLGFQPDWIVTNPPFKAAEEFARRSVAEAKRGAALLVRLQWLEGAKRWQLFADLPPDFVFVCAERVPMHRGRWEPDGSTATSYCWVAWLQPDQRKAMGLPARGDTMLRWIAPFARKRLTWPDDAARFGAKTPAPLLKEAP